MLVRQGDIIFPLSMKIVRMAIPFLLVALAAPGCKKTEKQPEEVLSLEAIPFAKDAAGAREAFEKAGWKVQSETPERSTFYFPAAVPEELRKLPVMGSQGPAPEPYTMQIFFHEGKAVAAILHRVDQTARMKAFAERLSVACKLPTFQMNETREKTPGGNVLTEGKAVAETDDYVFQLMRSSMQPAEEKMKDGMNDEMELRIYPRRLNEGISAEALSKN